MMQHHTFQLRLRNGDKYYVFSTVNLDEWETRVKNRLTIQATRFLDKIHMEGVTIHNVVSIRDVSDQVRVQYEEQRRLIFDSYHLVKEIMQYKDSAFVKKMIKYVLDSRENDESKRRFWRVVNEKYYGLDIHPLMEYEIDELEKILYYCKHPKEQKALQWMPVIKYGAVTAGTIITGWVLYIMYLQP